MSSEDLFDEEIEEVEFSYIEPNYTKTGLPAADIDICADLEWRKMKPPKKSTSDYNSFVTARQIDFVRALISGKNLLKTDFETQKNIPVVKESPATKCPSDSYKVHVSLKQKKSSVKFLNSQIHDL